MGTAQCISPFINRLVSPYEYFDIAIIALEIPISVHEATKELVNEINFFTASPKSSSNGDSKLRLINKIFNTCIFEGLFKKMDMF